MQQKRNKQIKDSDFSTIVNMDYGFATHVTRHPLWVIFIHGLLASTKPCVTSYWDVWVGWHKESGCQRFIQQICLVGDVNLTEFGGGAPPQEIFEELSAVLVSFSFVIHRKIIHAEWRERRRAGWMRLWAHIQTKTLFENKRTCTTTLFWITVDSDLCVCLANLSFNQAGKQETCWCKLAELLPCRIKFVLSVFPGHHSNADGAATGWTDPKWWITHVRRHAVSFKVMLTMLIGPLTTVLMVYELIIVEEAHAVPFI